MGGTRDDRVDAYIERKAEFARPILTHLRDRVHAACPEVEEAIKWSSPAFLYKGQILCSMAAFKGHAAFGFWRGAEVTGTPEERSAMGQFGRIATIADLPDDATLAGFITRGMALIDKGTKTPRPLKHARPPAEPPADLIAALAAHPAAQASFDGFPPGQQREYVDWIFEAKRPETRARRLAQAVEWLAEGKRRNWKYENC
ncbi:Uncharacterized conserved protein YdeI, YjbR/CyaY-like superfamily, DUF1801 family [Sphingomonas laterariae]|uniref:Uncharacterized conserved protein YdeI, YjbR/CyaY-like superfamily, DUF1801 family n=1 Tax=Edaphosphingomonas laterariae TaxID=861865 RepID=A0A239EFK6_9SPHN|nr:YdeI/OmpD-associated family protein [Sphingomonas laterariae]SNS43339.1 Uncharacterized conserved protein YdeI, YjbR/CyaY-like superfamily, DUF1801 family [Sphingomonas laterariae]